MNKLFILTAALALASPWALAADQPEKAKKSTETTEKAAETKQAASKEQVRDWAEIDTNKDHLISPEEMETWLNAERAKKK